MGKTYDVQKSIAAQAQYCEEKKYPHFAPNDGVCYKCHRNIYSKVEHINSFNGKKRATGITTGEASTKHVTGCPHCCYSYCN